MKYMLDTNICIYAIKHKSESVLKHLQKHDYGDICISSITYAELMYGAEKSKQVERNKLALSIFLMSIDIKNFDMKAAECFGKINAELANNNSMIDPMDTMIAGHCKSLGYTLVTNNTKEFKRVSGLKIEDWIN